MRTGQKAGKDTTIMETYEVKTIQRKGYFTDGVINATYRLHASSRKNAVLTIKKIVGVHLLHITKVSVITDAPIDEDIC